MPNLFEQNAIKLNNQSGDVFSLPALGSVQPTQTRQALQGVGTVTKNELSSVQKTSANPRLAKATQQKAALMSGILSAGIGRGAQPIEVAKALYKANEATGFYSLTEINSALEQYKTLLASTGQQNTSSVNVGGQNFDTSNLTLTGALQLQKAREEKEKAIKSQVKVVDSFKEARRLADELKRRMDNDEGFSAIVGARSPVGWLLTKKVEDPTKPGEKRVVGRSGTEAAAFRNAFDQFINILTVQARQDIKGQGTITDNETKMLKDAATLADANLSEKDFRNEIEKMTERLDKAVQSREAQAGVADLDFSKIDQLSDEEAKQVFQKTLAEAEKNPFDPKNEKFIYAVKMGKIDPVTGKSMKGKGTLTEKEIGGVGNQGSQGSEEGGTAWLKPGDTFIFGKNGLLQNMGKAVGDFAGRLPSIAVRTAQDIANGAKAYKELFDYAVNKDDQQLADFVEKTRRPDEENYITPLDFAGASGKLLADLVGAGFELADDATGEVVSKTLGNVIEGAIQSEGGQKALEAVQDGAEKWHEYEKENPAKAQDIKHLVEVGEGVLAYYTAKSAYNGAKNIFGSLKEKLPRVKNVSDSIKAKVGSGGATENTLASKAGGVIDDTTEKVGGKASELLDKYHEGVVTRRLARAGASKQKLAKVAEKTGFESKQAKLIASLKPKDRAVAKKMVQLADKIEDGSGRITARPIDYVGKNMVKKQAKIDALRRVKGAKLGKVAKSLQGKTFDSTPIKEAVANSMDDLGIKVLDNGAYDFSNSVFKNLPSLQKRLVQAFEQANKIGDNPYQAHIFKKSIDELVNYGTKGEGLKGTAEMTLKGLRKATDNALDLNFPKYATINNEYRELANVSQLNRELFGKSGATAIKAGQKMRSVFSNASVSRDKALGYLNELEKVAGKYGIKTGDNVLDQALFAQALEKPYGTFTDTALVNEVGKGVQEGINTASSLHSPLRMVGNVASKTYNAVKSKSPEVQKQLLRKMFGVPSKTTNKALNKLIQYFKQNDGATYNVVKNKLLTSGKGYVVSPYIDQTKIINGKRLTAKQILDYVKTNRELLAKTKHNLGLWYDKGSGKTFLDTVIVVPKESQAINIGKKFNQISVWDLINNKEIPVGGTGGLTP